MGYTASAVVDAPAPVVWRVLSDVRRWPEWSPTMTWVRPVGDSSELAPGAQVRIKQPGLPVNVWVVRALHPGRSFSWTTGNPLFRVHGHHDVGALDRGRSLVTLQITESGLFAAIVRRVFRTTNQRNVDTELRHLRAVCEAAHGARRPARGDHDPRP